MEKTYAIWGMLLLVSVVIIVVACVKERRAARPDGGATDPMFRRKETPSCRSRPSRSSPIFH